MTSQPKYKGFPKFGPITVDPNASRPVLFWPDGQVVIQEEDEVVRDQVFAAAPKIKRIETTERLATLHKSPELGQTLARTVRVMPTIQSFSASTPASPSGYLRQSRHRSSRREQRCSRRLHPSSALAQCCPILEHGRTNLCAAVALLETSEHKTSEGKIVTWDIPGME